ncbi:MAG: hypothetical protein HKP58_15190 [Desulfatitalea sp.]|nr:hypothetical protein [Desulfatitalea sp.]NNK01754.1 hypothetical protein [Desulfatitalea sp.]
MHTSKRVSLAHLAILILLFNANLAWAIELTGNVGAEFQHFYKSPVRSDQKSNNVSVSAEAELYYPFPDSKDSITFTPFARIDQNDSERSHVDIRELKYHTVHANWELRVGIDSVFWGVTETSHLVNIINQIDMVESSSGEDLLGQPMVLLTLVRDWGYVDMFLLPGFRERTFPGRDGRPGSRVLVDNENAVYESGAEEKHIDFAMRWSHTIGPWDLGVAHFYGTSREPRFDPLVSKVNPYGETVLIPIYDIINQTSVDIQATFESWLLKLEAISRSGQGDPFFAAVSGFEYTFPDIASLGVDVGIISEYLYDERDFQPMNNDLALGVRLSLNDMQSTELVAAIIQDVENRSRSFYLEASRRMGDSYKVSIEMRGVGNVAPNDPLSEIEADALIMIELGRYF